jgi:hypothetical protein
MRICEKAVFSGTKSKFGLKSGQSHETNFFGWSRSRSRDVFSKVVSRSRTSLASTGGSVVEYPLAMRVTRVRFPASALFFLFFLTLRVLFLRNEAKSWHDEREKNTKQRKNQLSCIIRAGPSHGCRFESNSVCHTNDRQGCADNVAECKCRCPEVSWRNTHYSDHNPGLSLITAVGSIVSSH